MANSLVFSNNVVVRFLLIGLASRLLQGELMNMRFQCFSVGSVNHA